MRADWQDHLERALQTALPIDGMQDTLREAMAYALAGQGKRVRPRLLLETACALGVDFDAAMPFAVGLEMIHTYSLVHDDLPCMDDDDMRRGRPTCHVVWGEGMAVLVGDALLSLAVEHMLAHANTPGAWAAGREIVAAAGAAGMVSGQARDMTPDADGPMGDFLMIHTQKTAALLTAGLTAGACLAGVDEARMADLRAAGLAMGLAFQAVDDLLDVTATDEVLGKTVGKDAAQGKDSFVARLGLEGARAFAQEKTAEAVRLIRKDARLEGIAQLIEGMGMRRA